MKDSGHKAFFLNQTLTSLSIFLAALFFTLTCLIRCKKEEITPEKLKNINPVRFAVAPGAQISPAEIDELKVKVKELAASNKSKRLTEILSNSTIVIHIEVTKNDPGVKIGHFASSKIDIGDLERLPQTGPASLSASLAHEIEEQYQKQYKGVTDYAEAHEFAKQTESEVGGYLRLPGKGRDVRGDNFLSFPILNTEGLCKQVTVWYDNGNIPNVTLAACQE